MSSSEWLVRSPLREDEQEALPRRGHRRGPRELGKEVPGWLLSTELLLTRSTWGGFNQASYSVAHVWAKSPERDVEKEGYPLRTHEESGELFSPKGQNGVKTLGSWN